MNVSTYTSLEIKDFAVFTWDEFRYSNKLQQIPMNVTTSLDHTASLAGYVIHLQSNCEITISTTENDFISLMFLEGTAYINHFAFGDDWLSCNPTSLDSSGNSPFLVRIKGPFSFRLRAKNNVYVHLSSRALVDVTKQAVGPKGGISQVVSEDIVDLRYINARYSKSSVHSAVPIFSISPKGLDHLKSHTDSSEQKRYRLNLHDSASELHQDMIIAFMQQTSVPCSRHRDKDEVIIVLSGTIQVNLFNSELLKIRSINLSSGNYCEPSIVFIPRGLIHSFEFLSPFVVTREITTGPFRPELTEVFHL